MTDSLLERALRRDRAIVVAGLVAVVVLAWMELFRRMSAMDAMAGMQAMSGMGMGDMSMPMGGDVGSAQHAAEIVAMWAIMMAAMMLPGASPMILLYARIASGRAAEQPATGTTAMFTLGYLVVWALFSVAAAVLQLAFERYALVSPALRATSAALAGGLLIAAGIYQLTPAKRACLRHCRSPLEFVMLHWRAGARGAFAMGLRHGAYCVGCCWLLMLLLFVGGVMNVVWIAGLALYVLVEKTVPAGHWVSRITGVVLVIWGAAALVGRF